MKRLHLKEVEFKGEITAFLALLFILMMSLVGALVESASIQITKNRKRADTVLALESVFAEYNREMLDRYHILVRAEQEAKAIEQRLTYYGADNMTHSIVRKEVLTDHRGQAFYEQGVSYTKGILGIEVENGETYDVEFEYDTQFENAEVFEELDSMLTEAGEELPQEDNPLTTFQNLQNAALLPLIMENTDNISDRSIIIEDLPSKRVLKEGNYGEKRERKLGEQILFVEYLIRHFENATRTQTDAEIRGLAYEQEYLLAGMGSDRENLENVCREILNVRMAMNYAYLLTDSLKQAEVEAMAMSLCTLLTVPGVTEVVKHAILLAWAYGEGIVDMRGLLKGEKIPMVKTAESWQLQLLHLSKLGTSDEVVDEKQSLSGWNYQMYIRALLILKDSESISMRGLDMVESNVSLKTDECVTQVEITSQVKLRRGVTDQYKTKYGYQ